MAERQVQVFSKRGLPCLDGFSSPELSLRPVLKELASFYAKFVNTSKQLVVDFSEINFTVDHFEYLAKWLSDQGMHLYALDLSLNRIYSATWEDILPGINISLDCVELLNLGGNYLPALQNVPVLQTLQKRKVAFIAPNHSFSSNTWIEGWRQNAQLFSREAYGEEINEEWVGGDTRQDHAMHYGQST